MKIFYPFVKHSLKIFFILFHRHKVYGLEHFPKGAAIIAPNHASFLDPPLIAVSAPEEISFLARKTLFDSPVLGFLIRHLNAYPVTGTAQDLASFKLISTLLKENQKVLIFPEGERTKEGQLGPMKSGIGMLALRMKCPILPVYIHGTFEVWDRSRKFPTLFGKTACVYGTPLHYETFSELPKKEAQEAIMEKVGESLKKLHQWYIDGAVGTPP